MFMSKDSRHIAYLVSHGFAARMLIQTNLLGKLRDQGFAVSIITLDVHDPVLQTYGKQHDISLLAFQSRKWIWKSHYGLYRSYFLENLKSNPALYEKHYYEIHKLKHRFFIQKVIPYILWGFQKIFSRSKILRQMYHSLEGLMLKDAEAAELLKRQSIDLLVSTYPVNVHEGILLHQAKLQGITRCIHLLSWDNITCKGRFYSMADWYLAWGPVMQSELLSHYGISSNRIVATGVPHFDLHHKVKNEPDQYLSLERLGLPDGCSFILFGMSSPRFVPYEIEIVEWLAQMIEQGRFGSNLHLLVRPHPQNVKGGFADQTWVTRLNVLKSQRVHLMFPLLAESKLPWSMELEDMKMLSNALSRCLVCINSCSTLSIDALMAGKANIAPMFDGGHSLPYWESAIRLLDYTHIKKFVALGGTQVVRNYEQLSNLILEFQIDSTRFQLDAEFAKQMECGSMEGQATQEVVDQIIRISSQPL